LRKAVQRFAQTLIHSLPDQVLDDGARWW